MQPSDDWFPASPPQEDLASLPREKAPFEWQSRGFLGLLTIASVAPNASLRPRTLISSRLPHSYLRTSGQIEIHSSSVR